MIILVGQDDETAQVANVKIPVLFCDGGDGHHTIDVNATYNQKDIALCAWSVCTGRRKRSQVHSWLTEKLPKQYKSFPECSRMVPKGSHFFCPITPRVIGQKKWAQRGPNKGQRREPWRWEGAQNQEPSYRNAPKWTPKGTIFSVQ